LRESLPDALTIQLISEKPFSRALAKGFEQAINLGAKWTIIVDADVLISPMYLSSAAEVLRTSPESLFVLQGLVYDKFFGILRPAGNHIYRTSLLLDAMREIPQEGQSLRPESDTINAMVCKGFAFWQKPILVGIHDFGQYYRDIANKCFLQAFKHKDYIPDIMSIWGDKRAADADFAIAMAAVEEAGRYNGIVNVDADFLTQMNRNVLSRSGIAEKTSMKSDEFPMRLIHGILADALKNVGTNRMQMKMFHPDRWDTE
jgi:hypothetical protein